MRISHSWLQQYITFRLTPEELAEKLTLRGLEFEGVERLGDKYRNIVVGKVVACTRHPDSEKLSVCMVSVGKRRLQIVCGAPNVADGQKVAVALAGAVLPRNSYDSGGQPLTIAQVSVRGVESIGMLCSEYELDLGPDAAGIMVLEQHAKIGESLAAYLGIEDIAYEIAVTPNRPDLLSHLGIAREVHALTGAPLRIPRVKLQETGTPIGKHLAIRVVDTENCLRFAARMIRGIKVSPSPAWLQERLRAVGLRSRNNVVDVTNYVMMECGHPMHAFDYALLQGHTVIVRQAQEGARFVTLDGKEHELPDGTVMVCDAEREVSIAGVMGGANSEISDATTDVVLESAYWRPSSIRRTSKRLGISSDASQRFERGADPGAVLYALNRATQVVAELAGGQILRGVIDVYGHPVRPRIVSVRPERVNAVLGTSLGQKEMAGLLRSLGLSLVRHSSKKLVFGVPTFRVDLDREIDLIEEIARLHGYDRIEDKTTAEVDFSGHAFPVEQMSDLVREHLVGMGFQEALSNSLTEAKHASLGGAKPVSIRNPATTEMGSLRTSLVPGLLEAVARNQSFGNYDLRLFEIGHVFCVDQSDRPKLVENFLEEERVCILLAGQAVPRHWNSNHRLVDIFDVKGAVVAFLDKFALDNRRLISYSNSVSLAEGCLSIEIHGIRSGYLGGVRDNVLKSLGIQGPVFVAELDLECLSSGRARKYKPLPRFPKVRRDVAFVVEQTARSSDIENAIRGGAGSLLRDIEIFDVYEGENLPKGKKSLAFALEFASMERTLTDQEIEAEVRQIVANVEKTCGAVLRAV